MDQTEKTWKDDSKILLVLSLIFLSLSSFYNLIWESETLEYNNYNNNDNDYNAVYSPNENKQYKRLVGLTQKYSLLILLDKLSDFVAIGNFTAYSQMYLEMKCVLLWYVKVSCWEWEC